MWDFDWPSLVAGGVVTVAAALVLTRVVPCLVGSNAGMFCGTDGGQACIMRVEGVR